MTPVSLQLFPCMFSTHNIYISKFFSTFFKSSPGRKNQNENDYSLGQHFFKRLFLSPCIINKILLASGKNKTKSKIGWLVTWP